jgi:hypothetical protein
MPFRKNNKFHECPLLALSNSRASSTSDGPRRAHSVFRNEKFGEGREALGHELRPLSLLMCLENPASASPAPMCAPKKKKGTLGRERRGIAVSYQISLMRTEEPSLRAERSNPFPTRPLDCFVALLLAMTALP